METATIIFIIVSSVFAIGSLAYVTVDWVYEKVFQKDPEPQPVVVMPVPAPEPEPEPVEIIPEPEPEPPVIPIFEEITPEEVDEIISDEVALSTILYEDETTPTGYKTFVNIGVISQHFEADDVVTIDKLKAKKLIPAKTRRIKILAHGTLSKPLTIKANAYSVQAIKMIELTGGTVVIRRAPKNT